jgi:hypothetical protein
VTPLSSGRLVMRRVRNQQTSVFARARNTLLRRPRAVEFADVNAPLMPLLGPTATLRRPTDAKSSSSSSAASASSSTASTTTDRKTLFKRRATQQNVVVSPPKNFHHKVHVKATDHGFTGLEGWGAVRTHNVHRFSRLS